MPLATPEAGCLLERLHFSNRACRLPLSDHSLAAFSLPYSQSTGSSPLSGPLAHGHPPSLSAPLLSLPYPSSLISMLHPFGHFLAGVLTGFLSFLPWRSLDKAPGLVVLMVCISIGAARGYWRRSPSLIDGCHLDARAPPPLSSRTAQPS